MEQQNIKEKKIKLNTIFDSTMIEKDIKQEISKYVSKKYKNKCFNEHGYIINIKSIDHFECTKINYNGMLKFTIIITIEYVKPTKNEIYKGRVITLHDEAIMINVDHLFNVMIEKKYIVNQDIQLEDIITAEILDIEFNQQFNCIGKQIIQSESN